MDQLTLNWLRRDARVTSVSYASNAQRTMVLPRDPQRFALLIPSDTATPIYWWLGGDFGNHTFNAQQPNAQPLILTEDALGGWITESLWVYSSAATPTWSYLAWSYNPAEFEIYRRLQYEFISRR